MSEEKLQHKLVLVSERGTAPLPDYERENNTGYVDDIGKCCLCIPLKFGQQILGTLYTLMFLFLVGMWIRTLVLGTFNFKYYIFELMLLVFYCPMAVLMIIW